MQSRLDKHELDALLVTHLPNIKYLCGFTGSAAVLVVTQPKLLFFTDGRYTEQARNEVRGAKLAIVNKSPLLASGEALAANSKTWGVKALGIEGDHLTVTSRRQLKKVLPSRIKLRESPSLIEQLRIIKDADEIRLLRKSVAQGAKLFDVALKTIRPGVSETEVAAEMEYAARRAGVEAMSFETIVASGPRSALPHGRASRSAIPRRGFVVCDFGVILASYCSDMTRTVHVGAPGADARRMYEAVREAQQRAVEAVKPGAKLAEVDGTARKLLQKKGFGRFFTHSTGHGVGLEIHEAPRIAAGQTEALQSGMVITIEPGVYVPGKGGVRIEDMVLVTERGCEVLTPTPKELITI